MVVFHSLKCRPVIAAVLVLSSDRVCPSVSHRSQSTELARYSNGTPSQSRSRQMDTSDLASPKNKQTLDEEVHLSADSLKCDVIGHSTTAVGVPMELRLAACRLETTRVRIVLCWVCRLLVDGRLKLAVSTRLFLFKYSSCRPDFQELLLYMHIHARSRYSAGTVG